MTASSFSIVVAMDKERGIGLNGKLPWKLSGDMRFFRELTTGSGHNAVLMGRKTWDSLPAAFKPLPKRLNGVLSRNRTDTDGTHKLWSSLKEAVSELGRDENIQEIFVIGGAQIYSEALTLPECQRIYLTAIDAAYSCDTFFPEIPPGFHESTVSDSVEEQGIRYCFRLLERASQ